MGEVAWLRGEEKDGTEECYHGDGRTNEQVNICILFFLPDPGVSGVRSMGPGVHTSESFVKLC